jgi:tetratricopeptide (TPR) repeat protein
MSCPSAEILERLLCGNGSVADSVLKHIRECDHCQATLDHLTDSAMLRQWKAEERVLSAAPGEGPALGRLLRRWRALDAQPDDDPPPDALAGLPPFLEATVGGELGTLGPYNVEAELGRGGMGIVLRAFDPALKRTVAVKVLRPELASERARARFVQEAQAAARVTHDHLVPVYAVAELPAGLPYFVMEYLDGPSLAELIRARKRLQPAEAAALIAQAADGLAAAHAAGLIHRDIKPANIMLHGITGRAKVMDFGLARVAGETTGLTQEGILAGTPAYMSPEQAQGSERLDLRSDIYGLGATLYEALTGEVPFRGSPHLVLQQVVRDEPLPPRQLNDTVPRDLETICQKAMAKERARRYQTAGELADDLRRWQRGQPILARPVGRLARGWRWCRRNRRLTALTAALLLVLLSGLGGVTWQWRRAEAQAEDARRHFQQARETVDRYLTAVSEDPAIKSGNLEPLRRQLLGMARDYYEAFVHDHAEDPSLQAELGRAYGRLGTITTLLESPPQSLPYFEQKRDVFERLCQDHPEMADYRHELAATYWNLGFGFHYAAQSQAAWEAFIRARQLWQDLVVQCPDEPEYSARLVRTLNSLGRSYVIFGQREKGEQAFHEGHAVYARWVEKHRAEAGHQESYAWLRANLGSLYRTAGRLDIAAGPLQEAVALAESLVSAHPKETAYQDLLHHALQELAELHREAGQGEAAEATFRRSRVVAERLVKEHPANAEYRAAICQATSCLAGVLYELRNRPAEAEAAFREALAAQEKLVEEHQDSAPYRWMMYVGCCSLADLLEDTGRPEAALELCDHFCQRWKVLFPGVRAEEPRDNLRGVYLRRARALGRMKRYVLAREDFERAAQLARGKEREESERLRDLTEAEALLEQGAYAQADAGIRAIARQAPEDGRLQYLAAELLARCAAAASEDSHQQTAKRSRDVQRYTAEAVARLRQAQSAGYFRLPRTRAQLLNDATFASLRGRDDFRKLVAELALSGQADTLTGPQIKDGTIAIQSRAKSPTEKTDSPTPEKTKR